MILAIYRQQNPLRALAIAPRGSRCFEVRRCGSRGSYEEIFMSQVGNQDRFGGQYMIQDRDHSAENNPATDQAPRGNARQSEQSQDNTRQQGGDDQSANAPQGGRRRQSH
jgi:hypothetical protein